MIRVIGLCSLLVIICFVTFYPCLNNDFVNWDDDKYVYENNDIQQLNWHNINSFFSRFYGGAYVPLTMLSFATDYQIGGLNPFVYHRTNLIFHILNTLLIFWVVYAISKRIGVSFLTALFFAVHPLHVEPVAWVTGRKDLLYSFFLIDSLIAYTYFKNKKKDGYYILSFFSYIMALFSKPVAITLPFVLLALEYFVYNQPIKKSLIRTAPFLILSIVFFYIAVIGQKTAGALEQSEYSFLQQVNISLSNLLFYFYKTVIPARLSCVYPVQNYWFASISIVAIIILVVISSRYTRITILSTIVFLVLMAPVLQLFPVGQILADRYTYLSITGFLYLIATAFYLLYLNAVRIIRILIIVVAGFVLGFASYMSNNQCRIWRDGMMLWTHAINYYPDIPLPYNSRGIIYSKNKDYKSALQDFDRAISINPRYLNAYMNRGNIYSSMGDYPRALSDYNTVITIDSTLVDAYHNRGVLYFNMQEYRLALRDLLRIREFGGNVPDQVINYVESFIEKENR
ncbi:MAG: tetratricopeptide repeat protein [bacterium]